MLVVGAAILRSKVKATVNENVKVVFVHIFIIGSNEKRIDPQIILNISLSTIQFNSKKALF